ncbi:hypothetical protein [Atlantibacter subterraneus]|uniref:hypothetical protein n=1 Tax=Atlantibacter subterraneus TaxID=255519 RepID=UPI000F67703F|nr:hypothetical protein [Atlantibacter subterranea]MDA3132330.1 hypothetical protein [Atlantibacter subterranea]
MQKSSDPVANIEIVQLMKGKAIPDWLNRPGFIRWLHLAETKTVSPHKTKNECTEISSFQEYTHCLLLSPDARGSHQTKKTASHCMTCGFLIHKDV